jgi:hypothetical protein
MPGVSRFSLICSHIYDNVIQRPSC